MIFRKLLSWAIGLLPEVVLNSTLQGHVLTALSYASWANYYLPINTFVLCITMYLTVYVGCIIISSILKLL